MIEFGIVLTPENLYLPRNPRATSTAPRTHFAQERACFTLMRGGELFKPSAQRDGATVRSHAEQFGAFAIGLDPIRARALGAVPVIYFYGTEGVENISYEILFRLRKMRALMSCLAYIEAKAAIPERDVLDEQTLRQLGFCLSDEPRIAARIERATKPEARTAADLLDTDRVPAWNLVDWIDILLNFFQTADSKRTPNSLAYYQQREWRIVKLFGEHVQCYPLNLERYSGGSIAYPISECRELRARLEALNPRFFTPHRLDASSVLLGTRSEPFFDFVEELIVPEAAAAATAAVLAEYELCEVFRPGIAADEAVRFEREEARSA